MSDSKLFDPKELSTGQLHGLLLSAVAPRPIAFASTINKVGQVNLAPFSFFNVFSAQPPVLIFSPARRGRDNSVKHTFQNVIEVPEVVINTVNFAMVEQMSLASSDFPAGVNEFIKAGFTEVSATKISPPRVAESPVSFECVVTDIKELGSNGGAGNLVICEVVAIHVLKKHLNDDNIINTRELDMIARMGQNYYSRASIQSIFEVPKPNSNIGIGVDALPIAVRNSHILSGNELGRLGNISTLPAPEDIVRKSQSLDAYSEQEIHEKAKEMIRGQEAESALLLLLAYHNVSS